MLSLAIGWPYDPFAMALDRELIVRTALRLLEEVGLETLSLRRLAKELGVNPSALYWHFENKQELLDEMARAVVVTAVMHAGVPAPTRNTWDDWLAHLARAQWRAVRSYRDGPLLLMAARPTAEYQLNYLDEILSRLVDAGFSPREAGDAFVTISNYALGTALIGQQHDRAGEIVGQRLDVGQDRHSSLARIAESHADQEVTFERGLGWLIAGMRQSRDVNSS